MYLNWGVAIAICVAVDATGSIDCAKEEFQDKGGTPADQQSLYFLLQFGRPTITDTLGAEALSAVCLYFPWDPGGQRFFFEIKHGRLFTLATMGYHTPHLTGRSPGDLSPSFQGGFCLFMMEGTREHVRQELATHVWPSPPDAVADSPVHAIPESGGVTGSYVASRGLDRVTDPHGLDNSYAPQGEYPNEGTGTHVYVLDTGIDTSHPDFNGRALSAFAVYPEYKRCDPADAFL